MRCSEAVGGSADTRRARRSYRNWWWRFSVAHPIPSKGPANRRARRMRLGAWVARAPRPLRARCSVAAANLFRGRRAAAPAGQSDGRTDAPCGPRPLLGSRDFWVLLEALAQAEHRPDRQGLRTAAVRPRARCPRRPRKWDRPRAEPAEAMSVYLDRRQRTASRRYKWNIQVRRQG
jgi:hypothetical protein